MRGGGHARNTRRCAEVEELRSHSSPSVWRRTLGADRRPAGPMHDVMIGLTVGVHGVPRDAVVQAMRDSADRGPGDEDHAPTRA